VHEQDFVAAAASAVDRMSFGELVALGVFAGAIDVGPWIGDAAATVAQAYRDAPGRRPIAVAVDRAFGVRLHAPFDASAQQWWTTDWPGREEFGPLFRDFERVYESGEFTWAGLWTVTDPPIAAHAQLADAWEMYPGPITRWHLPVSADARVHEVHRPADWVALVADHPRESNARGTGWELPGPNQSASLVAPLLDLPGQRAARPTIRRRLVADWRSVAEHYDAVHLSWAGFLTSEGCISDLGGGDVAMMRYWFSERTHWLADVFGEPEPIGTPMDHAGAPGEPMSPERRRRDRAALTALLGRGDPG